MPCHGKAAIVFRRNPSGLDRESIIIQTIFFYLIDIVDRYFPFDEIIKEGKIKLTALAIGHPRHRMDQRIPALANSGSQYGSSRGIIIKLFRIPVTGNNDQTIGEG
jgi:hypothetical protein